MTITDCGTARLLAAIWGEDEDKVKRHLGLPVFPPAWRCLDCGKSINQKVGRCFSCYYQSKKIEVACSYCGQLKRRLASEIVWQVSKQGYQHFFCNRVCLGKWMAAHNKKRKKRLDWDMIWQAHLQTRYSSSQIFRLLGIPQSTIRYILTKMRIRENEKTVTA